MFILVGLAAVAGMAENVSSFESRACTSIQFKREIEQWNNGYPEQKNQHLPNIKSFMKTIKQEPEFCTQNVMHTRPLSVEKLNVHMASHEEYQPLQDAYLEFFHQGVESISSQSMANSEFSLAPQPQSIYSMANPGHIGFYDLPQIYSSPSSAFDQPLSLSAPTPLPALYASSPTGFSPPPQDPLVLQTSIQKKRIPAVPCHSNSICVNCKTRETTLWRRNHVGEIECNACNLYFRKNNRKRPLSLRKDGIMKRNRKPRCNSPAVGLFRP